tara:strand:- start:1409 stop:2353 length:945 start_codon:yes stop_codon:yes gene_type:complete
MLIKSSLLHILSCVSLSPTLFTLLARITEDGIRKNRLTLDGLRTARYEFSNDFVYQGQWKDGRFHGTGSFMNSIQGEFYKGSWKNGKREGIGFLKLRQGETYRGNWYQNLRHGEGSIDFGGPDRYGYVSYQGRWRDNKMTGRGEMRTKDGEIIVCDWIDGSPQCPCIIRYTATEELYVGDIVRDPQQSEDRQQRRKSVAARVIVSANGHPVIHIKHGFGVYHYSNGHRYYGDWNYNQRQGIGLMCTRSGTDYYGEWDKDCMSGRAKLWFPNTDNLLATAVSGDWDDVLEIKGKALFRRGIMQVGKPFCHFAQSS